MFLPQFPAWVNAMIETFLRGGVPFRMALAIGFCIGMAFMAAVQAVANAGNGR